MANIDIVDWGILTSHDVRDSGVVMFHDQTDEFLCLLGVLESWLCIRLVTAPHDRQPFSRHDQVRTYDDPGKIAFKLAKDHPFAVDRQLVEFLIKQFETAGKVCF
ncbi:hypothetical protein BR141012304_10283 [Brucella inopinata]|nr:hypothetical protein BR141012304_10283 [Brucella inopinata]